MVGDAQRWFGVDPEAVTEAVEAVQVGSTAGWLRSGGLDQHDLDHTRVSGGEGSGDAQTERSGVKVGDGDQYALPECGDRLGWQLDSADGAFGDQG
jgi:hypothetical protein